MSARALLGALHHPPTEVLCTAPHGTLQATHIFDGLESWPSHLMYLAGGRLQVRPRSQGEATRRRKKGGVEAPQDKAICF